MFVVCLQAEDGGRDAHEGQECRRVLVRAPECARCRYQGAIRTRVEVQDGRARNLHRGGVNFCVEGGVCAVKSVLVLCTADECSLSSSIDAPSESNPCS